jgi:hypothetical protein
MACNVSSVGVTVLASTRTRQRPSPMLRLPVGQRGPVGRGSPVALSARAARALAGDASLHTAVVAYWVRRNRWASRLPRGGQAAQVRAARCSDARCPNVEPARVTSHCQFIFTCTTALRRSPANPGECCWGGGWKPAAPGLHLRCGGAGGFRDRRGGVAGVRPQGSGGRRARLGANAARLPTHHQGVAGAVSPPTHPHETPPPCSAAPLAANFSHISPHPSPPGRQTDGVADNGEAGDVQEVSNEFKSTLQSEIGLDEIKRDLQMPPTTSKPAPPPPVSRDVPSELFVSDDDVVTEDMKVRAVCAALPRPAALCPRALHAHSPLCR